MQYAIEDKSRSDSDKIQLKMEFSLLSFHLDEDFDDHHRLSELDGEKNDNSSLDCFISLPSDMIGGTTSFTKSMRASHFPIH